jgi:hypothetical protein
VIQQRADITEYLRDYIVKHNLEHPTGLGRIYRVVHETTKRDTERGPSVTSSSQLVTRLSHPNGWWRDSAQQWLVERADKPVAPELVELASGAKDWRTRVHALWTLDGLDAIDQATAAKALEDPSRDVRVTAIRISERWLGEANNRVQAAVLRHLDDEDWSVREQLAASLGALPAGPRERAVVSMLDRHADDPVVVDAALSGIRGSESAVQRQRPLSVTPRSRWSPPRSSVVLRMVPSRVSSMRSRQSAIPCGSVRRSCAGRRWHCLARSHQAPAADAAAVRRMRRICHVRLARVDAPVQAAHTRLSSARPRRTRPEAAVAAAEMFGSTASRPPSSELPALEGSSGRGSPACSRVWNGLASRGWRHRRRR